MPSKTIKIKLSEKSKLKETKVQDDVKPIKIQIRKDNIQVEEQPIESKILSKNFKKTNNFVIF